MKLKLFALFIFSLILVSIPSHNSYAASRFSALPDFFGLDDANNASWPGGAEATCTTVTVSISYPGTENPIGIPEPVYSFVEWFLVDVRDVNNTIIPSETGLIGTFPVGTQAGHIESMDFDFTSPLDPNESYFLNVSYAITGGTLDGGSGSFSLGAIGDHPYWQFRAGDTGNLSDKSFFCNPAIENDPPTVYILGDTTELEGNGSAVTHNVTLFLDKPSNEPIIVDLESRTAAGLPAYPFTTPSFNGYSTRGIQFGSGVCQDSGDPTCIVPTYTTVTIPAGQTTLNVPISLTGNSSYDLTIPIENEHNVQIIRAGNALIGTPTENTLAQRNDDACQAGPAPCNLILNFPGGSQLIPADPVTFLVDNVTVDETDGVAILDVTLSVPNPLASLTINYATTSTNRNAVAGADYQATTSQIVFANGQQTQQVLIPLIYDPAVEPNESFGVTFSKSGTEMSETVTVGVLINDVFGVPAPLPAEPTNLLTQGDLITVPAQPTYIWNHDPTHTTSYRLYISKSGLLIDHTYVVGAGITCTATCSIQPAETLGMGDYTWWVQGINHAGGTWNAVGATFHVGPPPPLAPTNLTDQVVDNTVTFTWDHDANATWYQLYVNKPSGNVLAKWYEVGNGLTCSSTCSITPTHNFQNNNYTWWVQGYNNAGNGPWSASDTFTINVPLPVQPTGLAESGSLVTPPVQPTYTWNHDPNTTWYQVQLNGPSGTVFVKWYEVGNGLTCTSTCSITPTGALSNGAHTWWVQGYNNVGMGLWSTGDTFTVAVPPPAKPTNLIVDGDVITLANPTFNWSEDTSAIWYQVYITGPNGFLSIKWAQVGVGAICNSGTCSATFGLALPLGNYTFWVLGWNNAMGSGPWSEGESFEIFTGA